MDNLYFLKMHIVFSFTMIENYFFAKSLCSCSNPVCSGVPKASAIIGNLYLNLPQSDYCTTLNGANGEHTNSDDVDRALAVMADLLSDAHNEQQQRARAHKESKNHQHKKPVNTGAGKRVNKKHQKTKQNSNNNKNFVPAPHNSESSIQEIYVESNFPDGCTGSWAGSEFVSMVSNNPFSSLIGEVTGKVYKLGIVGQAYENVVRSGPGFVVVEEGKGDFRILNSAWEEMVLPAQEGRQIHGYSTLVFLPFKNHVSEKIPSKTASHTMEAMKALASIWHGKYGIPLDALISTCDALHTQKTISNTPTRRECLELGRKPQFEIRSVEAISEMHYISNLGVSFTYENPMRLDAVECLLPDDYSFRNRYTVTIRGNASINIKDYNTEVDPCDYPLLPYLGDVKPKWFHTQYFRFVGQSVRPFVCYDNSNNNTVKGMKRFLASRGFDDVYYRNQGLVLYHLHIDIRGLENNARFNRIHKCELLLATTRTKFFVENNELSMWVGTHKGSHSLQLQGSAVDSEEVAFYTSLGVDLNVSSKSTEFVASCLHELIHDCNRSKIQRWCDNLKTGKHWVYYKGFDTFLTLMEPILSRTFNANITHVKKELRKAYVAGRLIHTDEDVMVEKLNACVKRELAKDGKVPRFFVSYDAGCMYANELPELVKICIDGIRYRTVGNLTVCTYIMSKPVEDSIKHVFENALMALELNNFLFVGIYSDDTIYTGRVNGLPFAFCVDISSCDTNQNSLFFYTVGHMLSKFHLQRAVGLLEQCGKQIKVRNPWDKTAGFDVDFHGLFEGSGTVLTTILNHTASYAGAMSTAYLLDSVLINVRQSENPDDYISAIIKVANSFVGHKVSVSSCKVDGVVVHEKLQFLKKSCMYATDGSLVVSTNTGCILRSLGTTEGVMEARQLGLTQEEFAGLTHQKRSDLFFSRVIDGYKNEPSDPILEALRARFNTTTGLGDRVPPLASDVNPELILGCRSDKVVTMASFCKRYDLDNWEVEQLCAQIAGCAIGRVLPSTACDKIYKTDYDVSEVVN